LKSNLWSLHRLIVAAGLEACLHLPGAMVSLPASPSLRIEHYRDLTLGRQCPADSDPGPSARSRQIAHVDDRQSLALTREDVTGKKKVLSGARSISEEVQTGSMTSVMLLCIHALQLEYQVYVRWLALLKRPSKNRNRRAINVRQGASHDSSHRRKKP
jgi:hypothetical protein